MDHAMALAGVMDAVRRMAANANISEDDLVELLVLDGYDRISAEKLNVFVPCAFSWPLLKRLGLAAFPDHFIARDACGTEVKIPVEDQHYFTAALALAFSVFENGWTDSVPRSTYELVVGRSAEMDAINRVCAEGGTLEGATLHPVQLGRLTAEEALDG